MSWATGLCTQVSSSAAPSLTAALQHHLLPSSPPAFLVAACRLISSTSLLAAARHRHHHITSSPPSTILAAAHHHYNSIPSSPSLLAGARHYHHIPSSPSLLSATRNHLFPSNTSPSLAAARHHLLPSTPFAAAPLMTHHRHAFYSASAPPPPHCGPHSSQDTLILRAKNVDVVPKQVWVSYMVEGAPATRRHYHHLPSSPSLLATARNHLLPSITSPSLAVPRHHRHHLLPSSPFAVAPWMSTPNHRHPFSSASSPDPREITDQFKEVISLMRSVSARGVIPEMDELKEIIYLMLNLMLLMIFYFLSPLVARVIGFWMGLRLYTILHEPQQRQQTGGPRTRPIDDAYEYDQ